MGNATFLWMVLLLKINGYGAEGYDASTEVDVREHPSFVSSLHYGVDDNGDNGCYGESEGILAIRNRAGNVRQVYCGDRLPDKLIQSSWVQFNLSSEIPWVQDELHEHKQIQLSSVLGWKELLWWTGEGIMSSEMFSCIKQICCFLGGFVLFFVAYVTYHSLVYAFLKTYCKHNIQLSNKRAKSKTFDTLDVNIYCLSFFIIFGIKAALAQNTSYSSVATTDITTMTTQVPDTFFARDRNVVYNELLGLQSEFETMKLTGRSILFSLDNGTFSLSLYDEPGQKLCVHWFDGWHFCGFMVEDITKIGNLIDRVSLPAITYNLIPARSWHPKVYSCIFNQDLPFDFREPLDDLIKIEKGDRTEWFNRKWKDEIMTYIDVSYVAVNEDRPEGGTYTYKYRAFREIVACSTKGVPFPKNVRHDDEFSVIRSEGLMTSKQGWCLIRSATKITEHDTPLERKFMLQPRHFVNLDSPLPTFNVIRAGTLTGCRRSGFAKSWICSYNLPETKIIPHLTGNETNFYEGYVRGRSTGGRKSSFLEGMFKLYDSDVVCEDMYDINGGDKCVCLAGLYGLRGELDCPAEVIDSRQSNKIKGQSSSCSDCVTHLGYVWEFMPDKRRTFGHALYDYIDYKYICSDIYSGNFYVRSSVFDYHVKSTQPLPDDIPNNTTDDFAQVRVCSGMLLRKISTIKVRELESRALPDSPEEFVYNNGTFNFYNFISNGANGLYTTFESMWYVEPSVVKFREGNRVMELRSYLKECKESIWPDGCVTLKGRSNTINYLLECLYWLLRIVLSGLAETGYRWITILIGYLGHKYFGEWIMKEKMKSRAFFLLIHGDKEIRSLAKRIYKASYTIQTTQHRQVKGKEKEIKMMYQHNNKMDFSELRELNSELDAVLLRSNLCGGWTNFTIGITWYFPAYYYMVCYAQFAWSAFFWFVGIFLWYNNDAQSDETEYKKMDRSEADSWTRRLYNKVGRTEAVPNNDLTFNTIEDGIRNRSDVKSTKIHKSSLKTTDVQWKKVYIFWLLIFNFLIFPVTAVVNTYVVDCSKDGVCTRKISVNEFTFAADGSTIPITLQNPDTGNFDGSLEFIIKEFKVVNKLEYDYSVPHDIEFLTCAQFRDTSDCDGDCSAPWTYTNGHDFTDRFMNACNAKIRANGMNPWAYGHKRENARNQGYCAGIAFAKPSGDCARAYIVQNAEITTSIEINLVLPENTYTYTIDNIISTQTVKFGPEDFGELTFSIKDDAFSMKGKRILCAHMGEEDNPELSCRMNAPGIDQEARWIRTRGEGDSGFNAYRAPGFTVDMDGCSNCPNRFATAGCQCNCGMNYNFKGLGHLTLGEFKGVGDELRHDGCASAIEDGVLEAQEVTGYCLNPSRTTESDCNQDGNPFWYEIIPNYPVGAKMIRKSCGSLSLQIIATVKADYDSAVESTLIQASDLKATGSGCWGRSCYGEIIISSDLAGQIIMSDGSASPCVTTTYVTAGVDTKVYATFETSTKTSTIKIMNNKGSFDTLTFTTDNEICDDVTSGSGEETGSAGSDLTDNMPWWMILCIILAAVAFLLVLIAILVCCCKQGNVTKIQKVD